MKHEERGGFAHKTDGNLWVHELGHWHHVGNQPSVSRDEYYNHDRWQAVKCADKCVPGERIGIPQLSN